MPIAATPDEFPVSDATTSSTAGKVVVITGASSGIGRSSARVLAKEGAKLVLVARDVERLEALRDELGGDTWTIPIDVTEAHTGEAIVASTLERFGRIDAILTSAGVFVEGKVAETDLETIRTTVDVNIFATFALVRAVLPYFMQQERGDIILVSSIAGHQELASEPIYSASKHAVRAFAQALRRQIAGSGVRVAEIAPGIVLTDLWGYPEGDSRIQDRLDQGTGISAEDVADAIHFMLSRPRHVTIRDLVILPSAQVV